MAEPSFIGYVGDADFHDGSVLAVEHRGRDVRIRVRGSSGKVFIAEFGGVQAVRANCPEGMVLYSLSELSAEPPLRRFAFINWDEKGEAYLEIDATTFAVTEE